MKLKENADQKWPPRTIAARTLAKSGADPGPRPLSPGRTRSYGCRTGFFAGSSWPGEGVSR